MSWECGATKKNFEEEPNHIILLLLFLVFLLRTVAIQNNE